MHASRVSDARRLQWGTRMDAILDQIEDHLGWVPPWAVGLVMILFAVLFALSSLGRLFTPARQALLPDLIRADQLTRANAVADKILRYDSSPETKGELQKYAERAGNPTVIAHLDSFSSK